MVFSVIKQAIKREFKLPVHIILHVTYRCNLRCQTCFNWENLNVGKTELSIDEFKKISQGLGKLLWLHISGGEPFLRDDLPEICEIFVRNNRPLFLSVPTNGFDPERVEKIGTEILRRIRIPVAIDLALDDIGERQDAIRGREGSFDNLLSSYEKLMKMGKKHPHLSTKITTVLFNKNFNHLEAIADFVYKKMKGVSFHTIIFLRGNPRNPNLNLPPIEKIEQKKHLLLATWERYNYDTNISISNRILANAAHRLLLELYLKMMKENKSCITCLAGNAHAVIGADGNVYPCELLESIGNIRDFAFDFKRLWKSSNAVEMRRFIKARSCWCSQGCVHMDNLSLNIWMYPLLLKYTMIYILRRLNKNIRHLRRKEALNERNFG